MKLTSTWCANNKQLQEHRESPTAKKGPTRRGAFFSFLKRAILIKEKENNSSFYSFLCFCEVCDGVMYYCNISSCSSSF